MIRDNIVYTNDFNDTKTIKDFFEAYNTTIFMKDDKDSYEDFNAILCSTDDKCMFYLGYIKENDKIVAGIMFMETISHGIKMLMVIYVFTLVEARRKKYASELLNKTMGNFKGIWFAEVLDCEKIKKNKQQDEEEYSGISCQTRDFFWRKMGFGKCELEYFNPIPNLSIQCNGTISYNKLLCKNSKTHLESNTFMRFIKLYFRYGYCANKTEDHLWEAYTRVENEVRDLDYIEIISLI